MAEETTSETETNGAAATDVDPAAERVAALEAEVADLKDRMLRTLAEMENLRRRTEREITDTRQYAVANFARDMLNVSDNLRRAIDAVSEEARSADPALVALIEGVEVTERGLAQTLEKFGVKPIEAKGHKFDPTRHQAMFEVENAEVPAGTVAEVAQPGYAIGERVLRPALVGIAKGGPKATAKGKADKTNAATKPDAEGETQPADDSAG
jgi:molecular chaperone GrpE